MKERLIREIQQQMLLYLNNEQMLHLREALEYSLHNFTICETTEAKPDKPYDTVASFITAKRTEGCSEKTLSYYRKTIMTMLTAIDRTPQQIVTDDLRRYLDRLSKGSRFQQSDH